MNATILNYINVKPPIERIFSRLGYAKRKTQLSPEDEKVTKDYIDQALALISLKACIARLPILKIENENISLASGISLNSSALAKMFSDCQEVLFIGATAGKEIIETIEKCSNGVDVVGSVIFDAVASEMTDATLDWIVQFMNNGLRRENKCLIGKRFSAGYGDFFIEYQKLMYEVLEMEKIGVNITEHFLLIPEKSVTALTGIKEITGNENENKQPS